MLNTPIAILGFGTEGQAALKYLQNQEIANHDITICDHNESCQIPEGVKHQLGQEAFDDLSDFQTIIRSPGIPISLPSLKDAYELNEVITSMTKLTLDEASDRITAVTGTNGKTTTTALCEQILRAHYGQDLIVGGNDRQPVLQEAIDHPKQPILMEASSFQFADLMKSPYIAAVLNITPNHLDWHTTVEEYIQAKANILRYQELDDWALLNANDENSAKLQNVVQSQLFWIGQKKGDQWSCWDDGYLKVHFDGKTENVLHYDQLNLKTHPDNICFAAAIAKLHFVPISTIEEQIKLFKGVEHRLEYVRTLKDVHFYNDSSSTSPESAMAAIDQFIPRKLILMLGGSSKKADFEELAKKITKELVRVYCYGEEGKVIAQAIEEAGGKGLVLKLDKSKDFQSIVNNAYQLAKPEDSIVLSPACASFDMFKNAKERGRRFKELINEL